MQLVVAQLKLEQCYIECPFFGRFANVNRAVEHAEMDRERKPGVALQIVGTTFLQPCEFFEKGVGHGSLLDRVVEGRADSILAHVYNELQILQRDDRRDRIALVEAHHADTLSRA